MHNLYTRIPLACNRHIYLMWGGVCAHTSTHFLISPPLQVVCDSLMNKSMCNRVFIGSTHRNEECNNSMEAKKNKKTGVECHKYLLIVCCENDLIYNKMCPAITSFC